MNEQIDTILSTSKEPKELRAAAGKLAASESPADLELLLKHLKSEDFLYRINTPEEYLGHRSRLRLYGVLKALKDNNRSAARDTLVELTRSAAFNKDGSREEMLIEALAAVRPATPDVVSYWDRHCQPEDGYAPIAIEAMLENGSPPAMQLFEKKMQGREHAEDERIVWLRNLLLPRRERAPLLQSCERLLKSPMSPALKSEMVDVLFDYKPAVWYTPAVNYNPPPWASYSTAARVEMRAIGKYVIDNLKPTKDQKEAIETTLKALETRKE